MGKHYVPQKYLAGFATPEERGQIWMYDKQRRAWSRAAITKVAQQRDYFDAETESELAISIERPAHEVLAKILSRRSISDEERTALALYVSVMVMRVPRRRREARALFQRNLPALMNRLRQEFLAAGRSPNDPTKLRVGLENLDKVEAAFALEPPVEVIRHIASPWPYERVFAAVRDMTWRFASTTGPSFFLTSDNPAHYFGASGIGTPNSELTLPLSTDLALLGSWQGVRRNAIFVNVTQELVKEVNRRAASESERFIFYHRRAKWVETLAHRRNPHMSRILWQ